MQKSLSAKQLSLLYALSDNNVLGSSFIENVGITDKELEFLLKNKLIESVIDDNKYMITRQGLNAIKQKHTVVYSVGTSYEDFISSLSHGAATKFIETCISNNLFGKITDNKLKDNVIESLLDNDYFTTLSKDKAYKVLNCLTFVNTGAITPKFIADTYDIFRAKLIHGIASQAHNLDARAVSHADYDVLVNVYKGL